MLGLGGNDTLYADDTYYTYEPVRRGDRDFALAGVAEGDGSSVAALTDEDLMRVIEAQTQRWLRRLLWSVGDARPLRAIARRAWNGRRAQFFLILGKRRRSWASCLWAISG